VYKTYAVLFARWPGLFVHVSGTRTVTSTATHRSFGTASMVTVFVSLAGAAFAFKRARPSVVAAPIAPKSAMRLSTRAFVAHVVVARIVVIAVARIVFVVVVVVVVARVVVAVVRRARRRRLTDESALTSDTGG